MKKCVCGEEMTPADWKTQWVCRLCGRTKPMRTTVTNADRIRAMSDEELANLLTDYSNNDGWVTEIGRKICYERIFKWLQYPAEEDEHA